MLSAPIQPFPPTNKNALETTTSSTITASSTNQRGSTPLESRTNKHLLQHTHSPLSLSYLIRPELLLVPLPHGAGFLENVYSLNHLDGRRGLSSPIAMRTPVATQRWKDSSNRLQKTVKKWENLIPLSVLDSLYASVIMKTNDKCRLVIEVRAT